MRHLSNKRLSALQPVRPRPCPPGHPDYDPTTLLVPQAALAAMTPFGRQFWALKARAMDLVLFVRSGSFYNLFGGAVGRWGGRLGTCAEARFGERAAPTDIPVPLWGRRAGCVGPWHHC